MQAQWALHNKDWRTAASILVSSGEFGRAIDIMATHNLADDLIDVVGYRLPLRLTNLIIPSDSFSDVSSFNDLN